MIVKRRRAHTGRHLPNTSCGSCYTKTTLLSNATTTPAPNLRYFQTDLLHQIVVCWVYYYLGSHYSQTCTETAPAWDAFDYHLGLHYSQTSRTASRSAAQFDYHLGLHYSQTGAAVYAPAVEFDYHLGLHYSQTLIHSMNSKVRFDYHLGLHYSQTGLIDHH